MKIKLSYIAIFLVLVGVTGALGYAMAGNFVVPSITDEIWAKFSTRFQVLFVVSVLIERSVETYLNITQQNGIPTPPDATPQPPDPAVKKTALTAALFLSLLVASCGLRLLETLVSPTTAAPYLSRVLWHGVDIVVSAGLMAGGSDLFHQVAGVLTTGLGRLKSSFTPTALPGGAATTALPASTVVIASDRRASGSFEIVIERPSGSHVTAGTLRVKDDEVKILAPCSWRVGGALAAGIYDGCTLTTLPGSGRMGIQIPKAVRLDGGTGALLLAVEDAGTEVGAIAVSSRAFDLIRECLTPRSANNITVEVCYR